MENSIEMYRDIEVENVLVKKGGHMKGNKVIDLLY